MYCNVFNFFSYNFIYFNRFFELIMLLIMNVYGSLFESFLFKILKCDKFVEILLGINIGLCFFEMK